MAAFRKFAVWFGMVSLVVAVGMLGGCDKHGSPTDPNRIVPPDKISMSADDWSVTSGSYDVMGSRPKSDESRGWVLTIPKNPSVLGYVQTPYTPTTRHHSLTLIFELRSKDPVYNGRVGAGDIDPAHFHVMLETTGSTRTANDPSGRWWAGAGGYELGSADNTVQSVTVPLEWQGWTNVNGQTNEQDFEAAVMHIGSVGLTFGGTYFYGHGANIISGSAELHVIDLIIS